MLCNVTKNLIKNNVGKSQILKEILFYICEYCSVYMGKIICLCKSKDRVKLFQLYSVYVTWQRPTLAEAKPQLPSALGNLTAVFGMGTGVTSLL